MWAKLFIWNFLHIGILCYIVPIETEALHKLKERGPSEREYFAVGIDNNPNGTHDQFKALLDPLLIPREPDTEGSLLVQQYIVSHFQRLNWFIEQDRFDADTPMGMKNFNNIIATHDPTKREKLTLACHFDSKYMNGRPFIGATDSAVPCAILLDVASKLDCFFSGRRASQAFADHTVQMLFFDGEEAYHEWTATDSLYGSRHLAEKWSREPDSADPTRTRLDSISLFILLDLIGTADVTFRNYFDQTTKYFQHLNKLEKQLKATSNLHEGGVYPDNRGVDKILFSSARYHTRIEDDHVPFIQRRSDLPVLHLIPSPFPKVWHEMSDKKENLNFDVTNNFNRIFRLFVADYLGINRASCGRQ